jgi:hypothetical protein
LPLAVGYVGAMVCDCRSAINPDWSVRYFETS